MTLDITLNEHEARLLGVLVEKDLTTPENYPMTLNAAITGANQKSNRFPVYDYSEAEVVIGFTGLMAKGLSSKLSPAGSGRVERFKHTAPKKLGLEPSDLAVFVELLLRGPQTPGELRGRASRMSPIDSLDALRVILDNLIERELIKRISPAPGSRAERYMQLIAPGIHQESGPGAPPDDTPDPEASPQEASPARSKSSAPSGSGEGSSLEPRVEALEQQVDQLKTRLSDLASRLEDDSE